MPHFYEIRSLGRWWPRMEAKRPDIATKGGKVFLKRSTGLGAEIRGLREVKAGLTLDQAAGVRFQSCRGRANG